MDYLIDYEASRLVIGRTGIMPRPVGGRRVALTWVSARPAITATIRAHDGASFAARLVLDSGADGVALFGRVAATIASRARTRTMTIDPALAFGRYGRLRSIARSTAGRDP